MVWQIRHNFDPEGGRKKLPLRFPFLEMQMFWNDEAVKVMGEISDEQAEIIDRERNTLNYAKNLKSPRCIKTHMPLPMLPPNLLDTCKVILVERSPKVSRSARFLLFWQSIGSAPGLLRVLLPPRDPDPDTGLHRGLRQLREAL